MCHGKIGEKYNLNKQQQCEYRVNILVIADMKENVINNTIELKSIRAVNEFNVINRYASLPLGEKNRSRCGHCNSLTYIPNVSIDKDNKIIRKTGEYLLATAVAYDGDLRYSFFKPDIL